MSKVSKKVYCGWDISLSSTGIAVIEVKNKLPILKAVTHIPTKSSESLGLRYEVIAAEAFLFLRKYGPIDHFSREKFSSPNPAVSQKVFGAWSQVDRAMSRLGYSNGCNYEVNATRLKRLLTGNGKASKQDVERAVRKILSLPSDFVFKTDDESDAVAVILCHFIEEGIVDVGYE